MTEINDSDAPRLPEFTDFVNTQEIINLMHESGDTPIEIAEPDLSHTDPLKREYFNCQTSIEWGGKKHNLNIYFAEPNIPPKHTFNDIAIHFLRTVQGRMGYTKDARSREAMKLLLEAENIDYIIAHGFKEEEPVDKPTSLRDFIPFLKNRKSPRFNIEGGYGMPVDINEVLEDYSAMDNRGDVLFFDACNYNGVRVERKNCARPTIFFTTSNVAISRFNTVDYVLPE